MPDPPPRAPTFPSFIDQQPDSSLKTASLYAEPSAHVNMDQSTAIPHAGLSTPTASSTSASIPAVPLPVAQSKSRIRAILLWRDPKVTAIIFGADMLFFYLTLVRGFSVLSVCGLLFGLYLALRLAAFHVNKHMGGKFDSYLARPSASTPLFRRESMMRVVDTIVEEGNEISEQLRDIIYCDKMGITAAWMFVALMIYVAGNWFSLVSVFFLASLAVFSLPLAYEKNKKQVDDAFAKASDTASRHLESGRRAAAEQAVKLRDAAVQKSTPYLEKAPPVARNLAEKMGLTPKKMQ
ncbi:Reticulon-1 [Gracilariopsis chorda]|uniref:Reticulon-like protein n=1 Tax=Gracilariopsis chorda TaxID=448386 RepID=A0A2V3J255_9FLOR|nr:Reticulon-1 [Gracilariopsis chorda]|eukprot:PXF48474.1 Reticulon-1 [Gracilariopsis chorda]